MVQYWSLWFIEAPMLKEAWDMTFLAVHIAILRVIFWLQVKLHVHLVF